MQKAQVFLREDQKENLKNIARKTGARQSELIRRGVDLVIEASQKEQSDWQDAWANASGIWKDHDDIKATMSDMRKQMNDRIDRSQQ